MASDAAAEWAQLEAAFDELVALPPAARARRLAQAELAPAARARLGRMLTALDADAGFLESAPSLHAAHPGVGEAEFTAPSLATGACVGGFSVDAFLGRGGMGEVYLAHRTEAGFDQRVALKLIRSDVAASPAQFAAERRILAALEHPGIARLVDGGQAADGRPYMAMEYVEGEDVLAYAATRGLDLDARLDLFRQVCEAVDYAHRNLVVHRDLKPANLLVSADGHAKLLDFGIARLLHQGQDPLLTQALLTPEYAAPEQLTGGPVTTATDVFALGVLLFELLTGRRPWAVGTLPLPVLMQRMLEQDAPLASRVAQADAPIPAARLRGDLDAILAKALRHDPAQRYPTPGALWADLRRSQQALPVLARGGARGYRARRFVRRHRWLVGSTAAVLLALAVGLVGFAWQAQRVAHERDQVLAEVRRTEAVKNYLMLMFRAAGEGGSADPMTARQLLDQSARHLAEEYRSQPRLQAELTETLGSLYLYMNDYDGVAPLLQRYLASGARGATPAQRADITVLLAEAELRQGNLVPARTLLDTAQAFWRTDPRLYQKALVSSLQLQAQVEKEESGLPRAIATLKAAVEAHDAYFGRNNTETANVLNSLGIAYQAKGDIDLADTAFSDSWSVYEHLGGQRSAAALLTLGNWATVAFRKNDFTRAESLLVKATTLRSELYGSSAALAAMQANLGKIVLRAGRPADALLYLRQALPVAEKETGDHSPLTVAILLTQTEALIAAGDLAAAAPALERAKAAARANSGEAQVSFALCMGLDARLQLARGDRVAAQAAAAKMAALLAAIGEPAKPYLAASDRLQKDLGAALAK